MSILIKTRIIAIGKYRIMTTKGAHYWVDKLSKTEMPVLSGVIKQLTQLTGNDDTEVNQLAEVILKDPHLTSQILRISNSVQYNPSNNSINTVSRAIVLLGFRGVKSLCISLIVVDSLLGKEPRDRLLDTMAKAFHAAVQARDIFKQVSKDKRHEEVFIAALLQNLGEMAFWAYGGQTADKLDDELQQCLADGGQDLIEKELGISFKNLTKELGQIWNIGDVLQEALLSKDSKISDKAKSVRLGHAISQLDKNDKEGRVSIAKEVASFTGCSRADSINMLDKASESAAAVALEYGAAKVCHLMPIEKEIMQEKNEQTMKALTADANLQLKILRDLANSVSENVDVNTVFQMALEGMHRGIGLERMVLAFIRQDRMKAKYVLGQQTDSWRDEFAFSIGVDDNNIFADSVHSPQPIWLDEQYVKRHHQLYSEDIIKVIGKRPSFIGVLRINRRNAALFYADRGSTNENLTADQFDAFSHFLSQAELAIQTMADGR